MVFSYNWLKDYIKGKLPTPKKLAELLTIHSFEVEEIKRVGKDFVLDIDVRPNRASDCFSHLGIAREISAISSLKFREPFSELKEDKKLKAKDFVSVEVKDKNACPRYTARVICDVKVGPSPSWVQERLKVCGLKPISNVVDIANYVMLETGQPLHAFDGEKLKGHPEGVASRPYGARKIIVRFAKEREKIVTLDEEKCDLDENILVIADERSPVAIAGIKGGKLPEIAKSTKIVVLESANFNPRVIRQSSKKIDLKTDASLRFEHGIDLNLTEMAINRAAYLIQKIAHGKIAKGLIDFYPQKACPVGSRRLSFGVFPKIIKLDLDYVKNLLGIEIPKKEIREILTRLRFKVKNHKTIEPHSHRKTKMVKWLNGSMVIDVVVPTFRLDISLPEDLIEEIGRIYGYQKIKAVFPIASLIPPKRNLEIFWEDPIKDILKEAGFTEVYNYSFISERDAEIFGYKTATRPGLVGVENPTSEEQKYLRPSLIPNLLKDIQKNQDYFKEIKIFELGKVFNPPLKFGGGEKRMLTGAMTGDNFYQAKGVIDLLLNKLGISDIWYDEYQPTPEESKISIWHPKKCAEIKVNHEEIGFLGEISPKILENLKIKGKIVVFDIDFEKLQRLSSEETIYRPISRFPAAIRDLAILVPPGTRVEEVLNRIETSGGKLIRDVDLFDIYEGEELPQGKKNLAFHIIYQAEDRTLSSKEIDELQNKIIKSLEEEPEWQVRR